MTLLTRASATALAVAVSYGAVSAPSMAQSSENASGIEEIFVRANKRNESLQDVSIAVTAIGQEQLELTRFSDVRDLSGLSPNLAIQPGTVNPAATVFAIRGINAGGDESLTLDQSIALYIDGIYIARSAASAIFSKDVEAVEVLRGPQGTLFGRNSTGGAISFRMRRPTDDPGLDVQLGYGNQDSRDFLMRLNTGNVFGENLRLSFTYAHEQNDGYVDNLLTDGDDKDPGANNVDYARFALESDIGDTGSLYYSFDFSHFETNPQAFQTTIASPTVAGFLQNSTTTAGCNLNIVRERQDALCLNDDLPVVSKIYGHVLRLENDFGPVIVRSTTGYRSWRSDQTNADIDGFGEITGPGFSNATLFNGLPAALIEPLVGGPGPAAFVSSQPVPPITTSLFSVDNQREQDQFSQEIEVVSNGEGPFSWVVGAFYFDESSEELSTQSAGFALNVDQILRFNPAFGALGPLLADALPAGTTFRALENISFVDYETNARSFALYGQGTYRFGADEQFGITAGFRYTWDKRTVLQRASFVADDEVKFSEPTGHITLDYRVNDEHNVYLKASRGYRSGGFNIRTQQDPFAPETIWSYEGGWKSQFLDNRVRLNVAAFYAEFTDQQISQPVTNPGGGGFGVLTVNAGATNYTGIEAEFAVEPTDGLLITGAFGYVDRDFTEFPLVQADGSVINIADQVLARTNAPSTTFNGAIQYTYPVGDGMNLVSRISATYEGSRFFTTVPQTSPLARDLPGTARTLVDVQVQLNGIQVFGGAEGFVQLWGKNILDEEYETRGIDFGALGYGGFHFGRPATYGISAGVSF